ncbi:MAG: biopolymer transporter ExbD [Pedobacter sp.]|nr:MAG: biopolymer transporter ExbD [Pedobacter sp.]
MPKVKVPRKSTVIDMTAMCDVASLLLTFFILTATARQPEPLPVDTPSSVVKIKMPATGIGTLTIGEGKVFFGVTDQPVRERMLQRVSERFNMTFTPEEIKRFKLMDSFGVPFGQLKQVIALSSEKRNTPGLQSGIPVDSIGANPSELYQWIVNARYAYKEQTGDDLRISIKGDSKENVKLIKKIIAILQSQEVNKFSLITSLEGAD